MVSHFHLHFSIFKTFDMFVAAGGTWSPLTDNSRPDPVDDIDFGHIVERQRLIDKSHLALAWPLHSVSFPRRSRRALVHFVFERLTTFTWRFFRLSRFSALMRLNLFFQGHLDQVDFAPPSDHLWVASDQGSALIIADVTKISSSYLRSMRSFLAFFKTLFLERSTVSGASFFQSRALASMISCGFNWDLREGLEGYGHFERPHVHNFLGLFLFALLSSAFSGQFVIEFSKSTIEFWYFLADPWMASQALFATSKVCASSFSIIWLDIIIRIGHLHGILIMVSDKPKRRQFSALSVQELFAWSDRSDADSLYQIPY